MAYFWPMKKELMNAILLALKELGGKATTSEINDKVAIILNIPDEALTIEDENSTGTAYSYKMRWARTELKGKGYIKNPVRGTWELVNND